MRKKYVMKRNEATYKRPNNTKHQSVENESVEHLHKQ